ncbi:hypothetical protein [Sorangium sp. So ce1000]|uniref:hypothetical protein n=1 Tax=Sorangium sp. So ce1000 TaxID=3133325 RepID=UPI003F610423
MPILFHQNMRRYGGGSAPRNAAYNAMLPAILAPLAAPVLPVAVAGFTEVVNNGAAATGIAARCANLGVVFVGNVACGITALARGPEYIGIGRNALYPLLTVGRFLFQASGGGITLIHQRAASAAALNALGIPDLASADYRGLVYVVVTTPAGRIAVGFLHNLYTFVSSRILVAGKISAMVNKMGEAASGLPAVVNIVARYIGGDFNVGMISPRDGATGYYAAPPLYPAGAGGVGTTYSGSAYDYWYSNLGPGPAPAGLIVPVPSASALTLDSGRGAVAAGLAGLMSDHVAVMLRII